MRRKYLAVLLLGASLATCLWFISHSRNSLPRSIEPGFTAAEVHQRCGSPALRVQTRALVRAEACKGLWIYNKSVPDWESLIELPPGKKSMGWFAVFFDENDRVIFVEVLDAKFQHPQLSGAPI